LSLPRAFFALRRLKAESLNFDADMGANQLLKLRKGTNHNT
jgi:hypothetical protein